MTVLAFLGGLFVGVVGTIWILIRLTINHNRRRSALLLKASGLYAKAAELFETASIWYAIGDKDESDKALDEAGRLAKEAKDIEDEADGKQTS